MRTENQKQTHQGQLTTLDLRLARRMENSPYKHFTAFEICAFTGRVSARDLIRKLKASGVKIGPAKFLRTTDNGAKVYGWRVA